jgi:hypothetical protein
MHADELAQHVGARHWSKKVPVSAGERYIDLLTIDESVHAYLFFARFDPNARERCDVIAESVDRLTVVCKPIHVERYRSLLPMRYGVIQHGYCEFSDVRSATDLPVMPSARLRLARMSETRRMAAAAGHKTSGLCAWELEQLLFELPLAEFKHSYVEAMKERFP